jgi:hypothetical protein
MGRRSTNARKKALYAALRWRQYCRNGRQELQDLRRPTGAKLAGSADLNALC